MHRLTLLVTIQPVSNQISSLLAAHERLAQHRETTQAEITSDIDTLEQLSSSIKREAANAATSQKETKASSDAAAASEAASRTAAEAASGSAQSADDSRSLAAQQA